MKIVFLTRSLSYGGAERQLVTVARGLRERGHSVTVALFYSGGPLESELREAGIMIQPLDKRGRWDVIAFLIRFIRFIGRERPDVVYGYLSMPNIITQFVTLFFGRTRSVWGVRSSDKDMSCYDWLARISYRIECSLSRCADLVIVNSQAGFRHAVAHGFPEERMIVIPNGIDTERFRPDGRARKRLRREWGINESEHLVGLVGRLDPVKDHHTFLKASSQLAQEHNSLRFVCVGDGPADYRQSLIELSNELGLAGRLKWVASYDDMPTVYNALDILVSSSRSEGFPNVIGEAMSCGVPCVVTDVGDSAAIVGDAGEVITPQNSEELKAAIENSLRRINAGERQGIRIRQLITERFSISRLVSHTETALQQFH